MTSFPSIDQSGSTYDCLVVGAGPAGLSAAATAADLGLSTLLVDEGAAPGGPMYRNPPDDMPATEAERGRRYVQDLNRSPAHCAAGTTLWWLSRTEDELQPFVAGLSCGGASRLISARQVIAATGATERPFPIPGWTLPGAMSGRAAWDALDSATFPDGRLVVAGTGPLLYRLLARLRGSGRAVAALLDTTPVSNWRSSAAHTVGFLRSRYLLRGARLLVRSQAGLTTHRAVRGLRVEGRERVEAVVGTRRGADVRVPCDVLVLSQGTVPDLGLSRALGCVHRWDREQLGWIPETDPWFESSVGGFAVAGDAAGIAGPASASARGALAALGVAARLGRLQTHERGERAAPIQAELATADRGRRFVDLLYRPAFHHRVPAPPETIVCRASGITVGQVRDAVAAGAATAAQVEAFLQRDCEGELCASTIAETVAAENGDVPSADPGGRSAPCRPVALGQLASLLPPAAQQGAPPP